MADDATVKERSDYFKRYYLLNKVKILGRSSVWAKANRERSNARGRMFSQTPNGIYKVLKNRVKKSGRFLLPLSEFLIWYKNVSKQCFYCETSQEDIKIVRGKNGKLIGRLTIERFDNSKGYEASNMGLACFLCNHVRSNIFSIEEMKQIAPIIRDIWKQR